MGSILIPSTTDDGTPLATSSFFQAFSVDPVRGVSLMAALEDAEARLGSLDDLAALFTTRLGSTRNLADLADAATARANLGLGSIATLGLGANLTSFGGVLGLSTNVAVAGTLSSAGTDVTIAGSGKKIAFYGGTPATKPTVTGSKSANAALTSLLSALATLGLVTDSST
mgnify:CR=1 FL=1